MICLISTESRIPERHPLRAVKESLLNSTLLMALYSVRSDRMFCEQLDHNILFRCFLDMDMTEDAFPRRPSRKSASV